jgi:hypothetical protein
MVRADLTSGPYRWPFYAGLAAVAAAVGIVAAIFASSSPSPANPHPQVAEASAIAFQSLPTSAPEPSSLAVTTKPAKQVVVATDPAEAEVFMGDRSLGTSPLAIEVREGESVELVIKRTGFVTQTAQIDSTLNKRWVKLNRVRPAAGVRPAAPTPPKNEPKPKPKTIGGGEIVNPWGDR